MTSIPDIIDDLNETISFIEHGDYNLAKEKILILKGKLHDEIVITRY